MRNIILSFIILNGVITFSSCKNSNQFSEINYDKAMAIATTTLAMPVDSVVYGCIGEKKLIVVRVVDTASFKSIKDLN